MSEPSRIDFQVKHYRDLAEIALDCARKSDAHRVQYLELARQWITVADRLENGHGEAASVMPNRVKPVC
jgi:hypothetical protein